MANEPSVTWTALGRTLERNDDSKQPIEITEYAKSYSMNDTDQPYGVAIDAPLAVQLIHDLWEKADKLFPDKEEFSKWVNDLLRQSFSFGFDKNVLLKTLSQPKCEGIRFYLCLKKDTAGTRDILSLVTVGVDADGKDLLYEFDEPTKQKGIASIPTRSMLAEYGFPPGIVKLDPVSLDPFVLFRYSK